MKCVILQPSYLPWRGYFHQIQKADLFVFYDDVQFDKHGWRNRNWLKGPNGRYWLTIPVLTKGAISQHLDIKDVKIDNQKPWARKHLASLTQSYAKSPYFQKYKDLLNRFYSSKPEFLADFAIDLTIELAHELGITTTQFMRSSQLKVTETKTDRLIHILKDVGATHYVSGPSAQNYLEEEKFLNAGITLEYMTYEYPEYPQLFPPFDAQLSAIDLLLMTGPDASKYIWEQDYLSSRQQ